RLRGRKGAADSRHHRGNASSGDGGMNGWEMKPLGEDRLLLGVHPGFACGKKDIADGVPHLRMNNISKDGLLEMALIRRIPREIAETQNRFAEAGDILFNNTNSTELVGKSCIFTGWLERCTSVI